MQGKYLEVSTDKIREYLSIAFTGKRKILWFLFLLFVLLLLSFRPVAIRMGELLIDNSEVQQFSTAVVLAGDFEVRFMELYERHKKGEITEFIFTRGDKTDARKELEKLSGSLPTRIDISIGVMKKANIPDENITVISDYVRSTRDEAIYVGNYMRDNGISGIGILTSKYNSRRACWIFRKINPDLEFSCIASRYDKFDPQVWWKDRRSIIKVVTEYVKWAGYQMEFIMKRKMAR